ATSYSTPLAIAGSAMLYGMAAWMIPSLAASMASGAVGFGIQETMVSTMMVSRLTSSIPKMGGDAWNAILRREPDLPGARKKVLMRHGFSAVVGVPAECMCGAVG